MKLNTNLKNIFLIIFTTLILNACSTAKKSGAGVDGDVYTGNKTVEYLASGVPDRVFFATNETVLTTASRETLRKQATWLRKNSGFNVVLEGHADERGTREYNLALGAKRSNAVFSYLADSGIKATRMNTVSFGKERPEVIGSTDSAWSQNRRAVTAITK